jgi:hypothetical protein
MMDCKHIEDIRKELGYQFNDDNKEFCKAYFPVAHTSSPANRVLLISYSNKVNL